MDAAVKSGVRKIIFRQRPKQPLEHASLTWAHPKHWPIEKEHRCSPRRDSYAMSKVVKEVTCPPLAETCHLANGKRLLDGKDYRSLLI